MAVIKVPRTPKSSFDPDRRPSALLLDQIKHLEWAALPASQRKPGQLAKHKQVKTEAQAAERVAQLTTLVLQAKKKEQGDPSGYDGTQPKVALPPLPNAHSSARGRKAKTPEAVKPKVRPARSVARTRARGKRR